MTLPTQNPFLDPISEALDPGAAVLDIGSGRRPAIPPPDRPAGVHYVGLDISADELALAPPGSYDETIVSAAERRVPDLVGRFDLIVSYGVLEHIQDVPPAVANFRAYLKPEGKFVGFLAGRYAAFSIANRLIPFWLGRRLVTRWMRRDIDTVFRAYYDHCDSRGLQGAFSDWNEVEVVPLWAGRPYFGRIPGMLSLYMRYEDFVKSHGWNRLATHYVVTASVEPAASETRNVIS
jgi:2-polyprenyl-6-hydroxyphenyl methylase/3-demethylubiquinone-9 3-methyltransferase